MAECRLSSIAEADLAQIADYTIENFGIEQARRYLEGLEICFQNLANNPFLGQSADDLAPRLRCIEHQSHVVYYLPRKKIVLIVRVLHVAMDAARLLGNT